MGRLLLSALLVSMTLASLKWFALLSDSDGGKALTELWPLAALFMTAETCAFGAIDVLFYRGRLAAFLEFLIAIILLSWLITWFVHSAA